MGLPEPTRTVLPNGCVVIAQQVPSAPLISLHGFFKGGLVWEPQEKAGVVNLMAQTLRRGTVTKTAQEIDETLERRGAQLGFSTSHEGVSVQMNCLPQDYATCVGLLAEILRTPTFPEEEVGKQRVRMENALRDALTRPEEVSYRRFLALAYPPAHPYNRVPDGEPSSVATLSRKDVVTAYQQTFHPRYAIFAIVGPLSQEELLDIFATALADWEASTSAEPHFPPAPLPDAMKREYANLPDKTQTWITIGHKGIQRTDEGFYAANVLTTILGAGWGRLFTEIRDNQGLAYAVWASLQAGLAEGPFVVRMGVNPKDVERAIDSAIAELNKIRNAPPTNDEVEDAKNYLLGRLVLSMETTGGIASMLVSCELFGLGLDYPKRAKGFYEPITPQKVHESAQALLHPDKMTIAIAGP